VSCNRKVPRTHRQNPMRLNGYTHLHKKEAYVKNVSFFLYLISSSMT